jgi:hypothetical protein
MLLQIASARIIAMLRIKGVIADDDESGASVVSADTALGSSEPALAELAVASAAGTLPAGPALRRRDPIKALRRPRARAHEGALRRCARLLFARRNDGERRGCRGTRGLVQVCHAPADRPGPHPARR